MGVLESAPSSFQTPVKSVAPRNWAAACPTARVDSNAQMIASRIPNSLGEIQTLEMARRIAEILHLHTHAIHHGKEEVAHRSLAAGDDAPPGLEISSRAAGNNGRKIFVSMAI